MWALLRKYKKRGEKHIKRVMTVNTQSNITVSVVVSPGTELC